MPVRAPDLCPIVGLVEDSSARIIRCGGDSGPDAPVGLLSMTLEVRFQLVKVPPANSNNNNNNKRAV